ncbi:MAG TPA: type II toxin-antitoxin system VapB family antitoxin [Thermoanaerobaculia bacterium]|nr:type II toxin-antitoxin system VapB family antitoxin [Thermoanaerobaculia bacterium]
MKRTNLVLDEQLLEDALRLSGERTYSRAVERALRELVNRIRARQILDLQGSGLWEGDLSAMRRDSRAAAPYAPMTQGSMIRDSPPPLPVVSGDIRRAPAPPAAPEPKRPSRARGQKGARRGTR